MYYAHMRENWRSGALFLSGSLLRRSLSLLIVFSFILAIFHLLSFHYSLMSTVSIFIRNTAFSMEWCMLGDLVNFLGCERFYFSRKMLVFRFLDANKKGFSFYLFFNKNKNQSSCCCLDCLERMQLFSFMSPCLVPLYFVPIFFSGFWCWTTTE